MNTIVFDPNLILIMKRFKEAEIENYKSIIVFGDELNQPKNLDGFIKYLQKTYYVEKVDISPYNYYLFISKIKRWTKKNEKSTSVV